MIVHTILQPREALGVGPGLTFKHDRAAVGQYEPVPHEEHSLLTVADLGVVLAYQPGALRDKEVATCRTVVDRLGEVALPEGEIELASPTYDGAEVERRTLPVRDAIEQLAYDLLEELYAGWENNDGAYGEFAFDVAERTITLYYSGRYTAVESYSHEW